MMSEMLNEFCAVEVMGWKLVEAYSDEHQENEIYPYVSKHEETEHQKDRIILWEEIDKDGKPFNPAEDLNDAMTVFMKLHRDCWEMSLYCDHKITEPWDCRLFFNNGMKQDQVIAHGKTAALAISKACVKTVKEELVIERWTKEEDGSISHKVMGDSFE